MVDFTVSKKLILIPGLIFLLIVGTVAASFLFRGIGSITGIGLSSTDECCADCGAFRQARYAVVFRWHTEIGGQIRTGGGLQHLHDRFLPPCSSHTWSIFHIVRGSLPLYENSSAAPRPKISLKSFKNMDRSDMDEFVEAHPAVAEQVAKTLFPYAWRGSDPQLLEDLMRSITMSSVEGASETAAILATMSLSIGGEP